MGRAAELAKSVEGVFEGLEGEMEAFKAGCSLGCPPGCGACCTFPDIEATVLEFLPLAMALADTGKAESILEELQHRSDARCVFFQALEGDGQGFCGCYPHRGMICRLFGFSALRTKEGKLRLAACRVLKTGEPARIQEGQRRLESGVPIPVMPDYAQRLMLLDLGLGTEHLPINLAIRKAIERVLLERSLDLNVN